ncbi:MAG: aminopeptidase P family protein [Candidatus Aenigmarchaeota archaeon]|nr:aminopeptidase P family protein [Candidatus Aenigmarchaeota archaeon]
MGPDFRSRVKNLQIIMKRKKLDAVLISDNNDVLYYTGYSEMSDEKCMLLVTIGDDPLLMVSPLRNGVTEDFENAVLLGRPKDLLNVIKPYKTIGFDEGKMSARTFIFLHKNRVKLVPSSALIKKPMIIKEPYEIDQIRKALKITREVLHNTPIWNRKEIDVARNIKIQFLRHGVEPSFEPIVASGRNTSFVHHKPGEKIIKLDDIVLLDMGCIYNGYRSDITRMFCRRPNRQQKQILSDLKKVYMGILKSVRNGVSVKKIDDTQRNVFKKFGYKERHRFGHSVGLSVHEEIGPKIKENMVITIEPGLYLKNDIGARLENMILIKNKGSPDTLSKF